MKNLIKIGIKPLYLLGLLLLFLMFPVRAEVWAFVDERGRPHFASEQLDARYELFFRGAPEAPAGATAVMGEPLRAVSVPTQASRLLAFFEVSPHYKSVQHVLRETAGQHNIDQELLKALIATESGFDPQAVSPRGAVGLMQVLPTTAGRWGVKDEARSPVAQQLTDPVLNIRVGTRYLAHLLQLFAGRVDLALAAYNAGEGAVQRAGNQIPGYPETQKYVRTVLQLYQMLKPPDTVQDQRRERHQAARAAAAAQAVPHPGGAQGRGNMVPSLPPSPVPVPDRATELHFY